jgi:hypothetical protein
VHSRNHMRMPMSYRATLSVRSKRGAVHLMHSRNKKTTTIFAFSRFFLKEHAVGMYKHIDHNFTELSNRIAVNIDRTADILGLGRLSILKPAILRP